MHRKRSSGNAPAINLSVCRHGGGWRRVITISYWANLFTCSIFQCNENYYVQIGFTLVQQFGHVFIENVWNARQLALASNKFWTPFANVPKLNLSIIDFSLTVLSLSLLSVYCLFEEPWARALSRKCWQTGIVLRPIVKYPLLIGTLRTTCWEAQFCKILLL